MTARGGRAIDLDGPELVSALRFSADGALLAARAVYEICIFEVRSGRRVATLPKGALVDFQSEGRLLTSDAGELHEWDARSGERIRTMRGETAAFGDEGLVFARLEVTGSEGWLAIVDATTGETVTRLGPMPTRVVRARLAPDARWAVAFAPAAGDVWLWDVRQRRLAWQDIRRDVDAGGFDGAGIRFEADASLLVVHRRGAELEIDDVRTGHPLRDVASDGPGPPLAISRAGLGASLTTGGEVELWSTAQPAAVQQLLRPPRDARTTAVALSETGERLGMAYTTGRVQVVDVASRALVADLDPAVPRNLAGLEGAAVLAALAKERAVFRALALSPDGEYLADCGPGGLRLHAL